MALTYFATDGSYGDGNSILNIDTSNWTDEMWDTVENAHDSNRIVIAHRFHHGYSVDEVQDLL
jgi:hypothetical protein